MKKILLCTTALVGLAGSALAAEMASGSDMQVSVGGNSKFEYGYISRDTNQSNKREHKEFTFSPNQKSSAFMTSNKAAIKAEGKTDMLTYGAVVRLQTVANMSNGQSDGNMNRSHVYVDSDAGSVQMGTNYAASKLMSVDASTIASATGGAAAGDYKTFVDVQEDITKPGSIAILDSDTLTNRYDGRVESTRKITYLSPRISGVQLGLSYAPDLQNNGGNDVTLNNKQRYLGRPFAGKNHYSVAMNYKNSFDDVNFTFSAAGDFAKAKSKEFKEVDPNTNETSTISKYEVNDVRTYSVGTVVEYQGFSAALSYANDGKSLAPKKGETASGQFISEDFKSSWMTAGLGYKNGPMSTSLTY
jgi:outer membrane protein OmpU